MNHVAVLRNRIQRIRIILPDPDPDPDLDLAHYPFPPLVETFPNILDSNIKYVNNTISIYNAGNKFEILTAEQALEEIIQGRLTGAFPL